MRLKSGTILLSALFFFLVVAEMPGNSQVYKTVDDLWAGYNPETLPLETQVVQQWHEDHIVVRKVYFTSEIDNGFKVRIVAYYAFPNAATHVPAILHIHGGGQTATREYVEYWARNGYAALSIDWGGYPLDQNTANGNTNWGPINANQRDITNTYKVTPDTKVNSWFHWAIACRRGITFLERQPEVDSARIGIFGVSMGGRLVWLIAGLDRRVKAAVSIYGAVNMSAEIPGIPGSEQVKFTPADAVIWRGALDATAYAPRIRCPFLFLGATDDFYGDMDFENQTLKLIPGKNWWEAFSLHSSHHIEPQQAADLPLFMRRWLKWGSAWPNSPQIGIKLDTGNHVPIAIAAPDETAQVAKVSIYYSLDPYPQSRFWRLAASSRIGDRWTAPLKLPLTHLGVYVFANVLYKSGISLSTCLLFKSADDLNRAGIRPSETSSLLIDNLRRGAGDWFVPLSSPNPIIGDKPASLEAQGTNWRIATRKVGDPQWNPPASAGISIEAKAAVANTFLVLITENQGRRGKLPCTFFARIPVIGGGKWRTYDVPISAFRAAEGGNPPASWNDVNLLSLQAQYDGRVDTGPGGVKAAIGSPWSGPPPSFGRIEWFIPQRRRAN